MKLIIKTYSLLFIIMSLISPVFSFAERSVTSAADPMCGPKSLFRICEINNINTSIREICNLSGYNESSGTTMYGLYKAAEQKGLAPLAVKTDLERLSDSGFPCIAFVDGNHFTLILKRSGDDLLIQDYPEEPYLQSKLEFLSRWNGEILLFSSKRDKSLKSQAKRAHEPIAGARIWFDKRFNLMNDVVEGDTLTCTFTFRNIGTDTLTVRSRSTCTCSVTSQKKSEVPPGERGSIDVKLDTHGKSGNIKQSILVQTNDNENKLSKLTLAVHVKEAMKVIPEKIWFDEVIIGETLIKKITLFHPDKKNMNVSVNSTESINGAVTYGENSAENSNMITLKITPHTLGNFSETVSVQTDDPQTPHIYIPVAGNVIPDIKVFPPKVYFGEISANTTVSKTVTITTKSLQSMISQSNSPYLTTNITTVNDNNYLLTVNLKTPEKSISIRDHVMVFLEGEKKPIIEIPLFAMVSDDK